MLSSWKLCCARIPQRWVFTVMGCLAAVNAYTMRISMSLAITEMVVSAKTSNSTSSNEICPASDSTTSGTGSGGSYDWDSYTQGIILSSFYWGYVFTQIPGGMLADKIGGKYVLGLSIFSTAIFTLLTPVVVEAFDSTGLIILRILIGLGEGVTIPAMAELVPRWSAPGEESTIATVVTSGTKLGTVLGSALSGVMIQNSSIGWPLLFYVFGAAGVLWFFAWVLLCYNTPDVHPFITDSEKNYLRKTTNCKKELVPTPWRHILTSVPVWALLIATIGNGFSYFTMVTDLPLYMSNVLNFSVQSNGFLSALPSLLMWIVSIASSWVADWFIKTRKMSVTNVRKSFTAVAMVVPAIFIVTASYVGCNRDVVVVLFVLGMGFMGLGTPGIFINPIDLSPNHSGTVMGMKSTINALAGIAAPYLIGILTPNQTVSEWRVVFWICFVSFLECALVFVIWGDGKVQYWNDPDFRVRLDNQQPVTKIQDVENVARSDITAQLPSNNNNEHRNKEAIMDDLKVLVTGIRQLARGLAMDQTYCVIGLILVTLSLLYRHLTSTYGYWKNKSVPCLNGALPGLGHIAPMIFLRKQMSDMYRDFYNEMPGRSVIGLYNFRRPSLMLRDPELVKCIMTNKFKDFSDNDFEIDTRTDPILATNPGFTNGDRWKASRQQLSSAFTLGKLKYLFESIKITCGELDGYLNEKCSVNDRRDTVELELKDLFSKYTAGIVASSAFGVVDDSFKSDGKYGAFRATGRLMFEPSFAKSLIQNIMLFIPVPSRIMKTRFIPKEVDQFIRKVVKDVIKHREERGGKYTDFLQLMIETKKNAKVDLSLEQLVDNDVIASRAGSFFFDVYESINVTLSFLVFQIAEHPEVQDRLRQEVVDIVSDSGGLTYEAVQRMVYMDRVINESARLYPAFGALFKRCTNDTELVGSDGITCQVSTGTSIVIPVAALHMDPEYWPKPEEFNPERFTEENKQRRHKFVYLPFGGGPRICPGQRVAVFIVKAAVATIIQKYRFDVSSRNKIPIQLNPNYFLTTAVGGLWVKFTPL
ncbi:uncharacterized protein LOC107216979 [Neodiprion lecontei]|uniref:Uncharacterized protein LOC107216979 n=1 Tax=Neodiprion lecontei TaxID=441921 RepID=A0ABM3GM11_NEOLC|nr:uncharacterized protein LOC107216979 [Neodiprion lecontei]